MPISKTQSESLPLLALRDLVLFPQMVVPLYVGRKKSINALDMATSKNTDVFLVTQKSVDTENPRRGDLYQVGTVARILQMHRFPDDTVKILVEGQYRARIQSLSNKSRQFYAAKLEKIEEDLEVVDNSEQLLAAMHDGFNEFVTLNENMHEDLGDALRGLDDPGRCADTIAMHMPVSIEHKQAILETMDVSERVEMVLSYLQREVQWQRVERRIQDKVKTQISEDQRNYFKREKLKAIRKELGDLDEGFGDESEVLRERIEALGLKEEDQTRVLNELNKLDMMPPMSAEATVIRNYLDAVIEVPWKKKSRPRRDLKKASTILNEDHYALKEVKERILENIAVQMRVKQLKGTILCLVGPPGVGKTSLGRSMARAMGREFVRISLGGVRDEAEIRGHRKTYIGAMPGSIIKAMTRAGVNNPLILLDEIDKMGMDFRGDPASALLEVLDPEQNNTFKDHYLELDYDLSDVVFVTTSNSMEIPPALLDRMEIIRLSGYTEDEKIHIAQDHLIPKCLKAHGVKKNELDFSVPALRSVIRHYTREAGVRNLDRDISKVCRKFVKAATDKPYKSAVKVTPTLINKWLGVQKYDFEMAEEQPSVGMVRGMAWTQSGGELLTIEAAVYPGKGKLQYTGSLGEVMQESIQAAMSVVRSRAHSVGITEDFHGKHDVHVHVPEGATPKDGPSAGITMCTALISAMTGIGIRPDVAMTGEITLRGEVLPIGGLKEKLLAAQRGGIQVVVIPEGNRKDLAEIPKKVTNVLDVKLVKWIDQVLEIAMVEQPQPLVVVDVEPALGKQAGASNEDDSPPVSH